MTITEVVAERGRFCAAVGYSADRYDASGEVAGVVYGAFIFDRKNMQDEHHCPHRHENARTAARCARKMLRDMEEELG